MSEYIERGALMDKIGERLAYLRKENGNYDPYTDGYEECYCEVEEACAADVAPVKHGTWEKSNLNGFVRCSACHDCYVDDDWIDGMKWQYCPRCGTKMAMKRFAATGNGGKTMRLIDADALLERIKERLNASLEEGCSEIAIGAFAKAALMVTEAPTIECVDEGYLQCWYMDSVMPHDEPVWTDKHIEELVQDFYLIVREDADD